MVKGVFPCGKCSRVFSMKAHLARHMSSTHGVKPAGAGKKKTGKKRLGRPKGSKNKVPKNLGVPLRSGRPTALVVKLGIRDMSIDELTQVIDAARDEARRRLADLQAALG